MGKSKVSLTKCLNYEPALVEGALEEVLAPLGGMRAFVKPGQRVMLKPNYVMARSVEEPANTHPVFTLAVARLVQRAGATPFIADSPAFGSAAGVARRTGTLELAQAAGVEVCELRKGKMVQAHSTGNHRALRISKELDQTDVLINLPKVKAHGQLYMSLCVKNLFGLVPGRRKALWHFQLSHDVMEFARMLIENYRAVRPTLHLVDGIVGMERRGPTRGDARTLGIVAAGTDGIAVDRVLIELLGLPIEAMYTLRAAEELGEGAFRMEDIEAVGASLDSLRVADFKPVEKMVPIGFSIPRILRGVIKQILTFAMDRHQPAEY